MRWILRIHEINISKNKQDVQHMDFRVDVKHQCVKVLFRLFLYREREKEGKDSMFHTEHCFISIDKHLRTF